MGQTSGKKGGRLPGTGPEAGRDGVRGIVRLAPVEALEFDADRLVELAIGLGDIEAQRLIDESLREIAEDIAQLAIIARSDAPASRADIAETCANIAEVAHAIGLPIFARLAGDIAGCLARGEQTAIAAVLFRLARLSALSARAHWKLCDDWA